MLTIITTTLNSENTIQRCLKSISPLSKIITQHIIIDGGSTDQTIRKIKVLIFSIYKYRPILIKRIKYL